MGARLAVWPEAMFLALDGDEIVGCAGLAYDADRPDRSEQAFTAVARRGGDAASPGAEAAVAAFAAEHGIREVYTWTQRDNADMRALNERLGFVYGAESFTVRGAAAVAAPAPGRSVAVAPRAPTGAGGRRIGTVPVTTGLVSR